MIDTTVPRNLREQQLELIPKTQEKELKLSRRKLPKYVNNPFVDANLLGQLSGAKNVFFTQMSRNSIVDVDTGEINHAKLQVVKVIRADKEKFVKIYTTHLKRFFELSAPGYKFLHYILHLTQNSIDKDKVYLSLDGAQNFFEEQGSKISSATYYRAVAELIDKLFIAETTQLYIFFINPKLFFNGDRVEFITQFIVDEKSKQEVLPPEI